MSLMKYTAYCCMLFLATQFDSRSFYFDRNDIDIVFVGSILVLPYFMKNNEINCKFIDIDLC